MNGWLLDTNVLSELRRARPEPKVVDFIGRTPLAHLFVSVVTLAEFRFGIDLLSDPQRREDLGVWLDQTVRPMFEARTLPISEDVMVRWRHLAEIGRKAGHTFSQPDLIIAATALHYRMTLVTRNTADYERTDAMLLNPWIEPAPAVT